MRVINMELEDAERVLRERGQAYIRAKNVKLVQGIEDGGRICGVGIWAKVDETTAKRVHIYSDGRPLGFTVLYGQACRALGSMGFTTIEL